MSSASARSDSLRLNSSRTELRKNARKRFHCPGWIMFAGEPTPRECAVTNVFGRGAKLTVCNQHEIPDEFTLVLPERFRLTRRCSVMWRAGNAIGIRFLKDCRPAEVAAGATALVNLDC